MTSELSFRPLVKRGYQTWTLTFQKWIKAEKEKYPVWTYKCRLLTTIQLNIVSQINLHVFGLIQALCQLQAINLEVTAHLTNLLDKEMSKITLQTKKIAYF